MRLPTTCYTLPIWGPPPPCKQALREHLNNENSSVKKRIYSCQNKDYKGINVKIIMSENDPANLRLYESFYIRKGKPTLNSREECTDFADLLF